MFWHFLVKNARVHRGLKYLVVLVFLVALAYYLPTGYLLVMPGEAIDLTDVVQVTNGVKEPGSFMMTTVSTRKANLLLFLYALLDPRAELERERDFLPPGKDLEDYLEITEKMMRESQAIAKVVALRVAGYPGARLEGQGSRVVEILPGSPAEGKLREGDIIIRADGSRVRMADELVSIVSARDPGTPVQLVVRRGDRQVAVNVKTVKHQGRAVVRILVETHGLQAITPIPVTIDSGRVLGPSAGLMFTLEIIDQLDGEENLTGGKTISGTGTISSDGSIGPIGGVKQKIIAAERAGARVFLVPKENVQEARKVAKKIELVPVGDVHQAVEYLRGHTANNAG